VEFAQKAELSPAADTSDAFAAPADPTEIASPAAPTEVLTPAEPQSHRREGKGGFFRRRRDGATTQ
jgi:hypothetical protein